MREHLKGKRLLALDIGKKRIGIAVCDKFHVTTTPYATIENSESALQYILDLIAKEHIEAVVLGLPKEEQGQHNAIVKEIRRFESALNQASSFDVYLHDESFSSKQAVQQLIASGRSKSHRKDKATIDKTAAAIILRSFLDEYDA